MNARRFVSLLALASATVLTGCEMEDSYTTAEVAVADGGYGLLRVDVPGGHEAWVQVTLSGASPDGAFHLLRTDDDAPRHVGWFDPAPWAAEVPRCLGSNDFDAHDSRCNPEGAGHFAATTRATPDGNVVLDHRLGHCYEDADEVCTHYLAVLSGTRLEGARKALFVVRTRDFLYAEHAELTVLP